MKYWSRFKLAGWEAGAEEISKWIDTTNLVETGLFWNTVDIRVLRKEAPTLFKLLIDKGVFVTYAALIIAKQHPLHPYTSIHIDDDSARARLQIPIKNTAGTFTHFFSHDESKIQIQNLPNGHRYLAVPFSACKFQTMVCVSRPTILRTSAAHTVDVPKGLPIPRITLTLGLHEDPVVWL